MLEKFPECFKFPLTMVETRSMARAGSNVLDYSSLEFDGNTPVGSIIIWSLQHRGLIISQIDLQYKEKASFSTFPHLLSAWSIRLSRQYDRSSSSLLPTDVCHLPLLSTRAIWNQLKATSAQSVSGCVWSLLAVLPLVYHQSNLEPQSCVCGLLMNRSHTLILMSQGRERDKERVTNKLRSTTLKAHNHNRKSSAFVGLGSSVRTTLINLFLILVCLVL